jgi:AcrR family transcriptional regulator
LTVAARVDIVGASMLAEGTNVRERILEAARELFLTQGYNGSNLRDIAQKARVSMGGIYHHFSSKEDIYQALLSGASFSEGLQPIVELMRSPEFPENLHKVGEAIHSFVRTHKDYFKLFYIDTLEFQARNVHHVLGVFREALTKIGTSLLARRAATGELADVHPAVMLHCVIDVFAHRFLEEVMVGRSLAADLGMDEAALTEQIAKLLLGGIRQR